MDKLFVLFLEAEEDITLPGSEDFLNKLVPNLWGFLIQLLAFVVMIIIFMKLAYKPVKKFLDKRHQFIQDNIDQAQAKNAEADVNLEQSKFNLTSSKKEAVEIISKAKEEATKEKNAIVESANVEIQNNKEKAKEEIRLEKEKALKEVRDEVIDLAMETSKSILSREVSAKDDKKLIDDLVESLKEKK